MIIVIQSEFESWPCERWEDEDYEGGEDVSDMIVGNNEGGDSWLAARHQAETQDDNFSTISINDNLKL